MLEEITVRDWIAGKGYQRPGKGRRFSLPRTRLNPQMPEFEVVEVHAGEGSKDCCLVAKLAEGTPSQKAQRLEFLGDRYVVPL